jgi:hypothetical protein
MIKKDAPRDLQKAISLGLTTEDIAAIPAEPLNDPGSLAIRTCQG